MKKTTIFSKLRIIGGQWKGRKISVIPRPGLRPTTDSARETLFNWLAPQIYKARCLDCFAGTGILSLEALSRYASYATLLELKYPVITQLKKNINFLSRNNINLLQVNTLTWLKQEGTPYDIIFIDPPFYQGLLQKTITLLDKHHWLSENALIYLEKETSHEELCLPNNWHIYKEKITTNVTYRLYYTKIVTTDNFFSINNQK